jgi:hypothetical protein
MHCTLDETQQRNATRIQGVSISPCRLLRCTFVFYSIVCFLLIGVQRSLLLTRSIVRNSFLCNATFNERGGPDTLVEERQGSDSSKRFARSFRSFPRLLRP